MFAFCTLVFFVTLAIPQLRIDLLEIQSIPQDTLLIFVVFIAMLYPTVKIITLVVSLLVNFSGIMSRKVQLNKRLRKLTQPLLSKKEAING